jgi:NADH-quinone oxidoreductase subunit G
MHMSDIEIEIDGKKLKAEPNQMLIQVADAAGIYIPRFCYHKHLTVAANCRMCLVEVEKSPKALPACATPVMPGMKVFTKSQKTIEAQRAVMEFLLINHPLDCPVCDQGGECELQDLSMGYGATHSHYDECKRAVADENLGPLVATEMTRCILCTRCVRFGNEIAGLPQLGITERGGHAEISTYVEQAVTSEISGNIIDLCPVGALTSKPYRFTARAWELDQAPSISPHDCLGSNLNVHTRYGTVKRVVSRENATINETWISDRDRFSYEGLYHADRLEEPMARIDGKWMPVEWQKAFEIIARELHAVIAEHGADKVGALASPNSTTEEFYLLQKIMRGLGSANIDHRLRECDMRDQAQMGAFPGLSFPMIDIENSDAILLIGSNIQKEQPLIATRIRKAEKKQAEIIAINFMDYNFTFKLSAKKIVAPQQIVNELQALADNSSDLARLLQGKQNVRIILGAAALHHPDASRIRYLAQKIANMTNGKLGLLTDGANSAGAWLAGAIPHRQAAGRPMNHVGLSAYDMLAKPRKAYVLLNVEPERDCANATHATEALKQAEFTVALSMYRNPILEAHAHVILPIAAFTETSGTFVSALGNFQSFLGMAKPFGAARPAWKILRVLANFLHLDGFAYENSEEIRHELYEHIDKMSPPDMQFTQPDSAQLTQQTALTRLGEIPLYSLDSLVRRSQPLQEAQILMEGDINAIRLHPETAKKLGLKEGDTARVKQDHAEAKLTVRIDERLAPNTTWIAGGIQATETLGDLIGAVEVSLC